MLVGALMFVYATCAMVALAVMVVSVRTRRLGTFKWGLTVYLLGTALWSLVDLWRWWAGDSSIALVEAWTMPATALVVAGVRMGILSLTSRQWSLGASDGVAFALHPVLTLVIAVVPDLRSMVAVANDQGGVEYGPAFWAHMAITYALLAIGALDMYRGRRSSRLFSRKRTPVVVSIWVAPFVASILTLWSGGPEGIDLMPVAFALTAVVIWRAVVPFDMASFVPIARSQIFEELADAVLVLDASDRILDANAGALTLVGATAPLEEFIGEPMRKVWPRFARLAHHSGEHDFQAGDRQLVIDVTITELTRGAGGNHAKAIVLRDVTQSVRQRRELARLRGELADLVVRDPVTGLHNRRHADETLPKVRARCAAKASPLSIAIIDVDHFKAVNDTHGHPVGDRVLQALAQVMQQEVPSSMLARIGGEEFLVMLPGLAPAEALGRIENLRRACARAEVMTREGPVRVTVSAGIAGVGPGESSVDDLMDAADHALYRAKRDGRNRTCVAPDVSPTAATNVA